MRRPVILAAAAMFASLGFAGSVVAMGPPDHAVGPPARECPTDRWLLVQPQHGLIVLDFNGDSYLCRLNTPGGPVFIDNIAR
jgi:hypothetical protein